MREHEARTPSARSGEGEHGRTCEKVSHGAGGYLHSPDYDGPYEVDGVRYCGRCHEVMSARRPGGEVLAIRARAEKLMRESLHPKAVRLATDVVTVLMPSIVDQQVRIDRLAIALDAAKRERDGARAAVEGLRRSCYALEDVVTARTARLTALREAVEIGEEALSRCRYGMSDRCWRCNGAVDYGCKPECDFGAVIEKLRNALAEAGGEGP